jgi:hypothetical protein
MLATGGAVNGAGGDVLIRGEPVTGSPAGSSNDGTGTGMEGDAQINSVVNP